MPGATRETIISPNGGTGFGRLLEEIWEYRELLWAFVVRDVTVRYRQTALGVIWIVLQPLLTGSVFALVFRRMGVGQGDALESLLFFVAGLAPWTAFAGAIGMAAGGLERSADMIRKVYFPRMLVVGGYVVGSLVDYAISMTLLLALAAAAGRARPGLLLAILLLPLVQLPFTAGLGLILGSLNARYHDVKYVVPFGLNVAMFLTVLAPLESWPPVERTLLALSPMTVVVATCRATLAGAPVDPALLALGAAVSAGALGTGAWFFQKHDGQIADVL